MTMESKTVNSSELKALYDEVKGRGVVAYELPSGQKVYVSADPDMEEAWYRMQADYLIEGADRKLAEGGLPSAVPNDAGVMPDFDDWDRIDGN